MLLLWANTGGRGKDGDDMPAGVNTESLAQMWVEEVKLGMIQ